jgi:hypothetical protein
MDKYTKVNDAFCEELETSSIKTPKLMMMSIAMLLVA